MFCQAGNAQDAHDHNPQGCHVRDEQVHAQLQGTASQYEDFLNKNKDGQIVYLELGVGGNTPGIIKYPFWKMTFANSKATYICINRGEAAVPEEIERQSICVNSEIWEFLKNLIPQN